jgi:hypothetical protein
MALENESKTIWSKYEPIGNVMFVKLICSYLLLMLVARTIPWSIMHLVWCNVGRISKKCENKTRFQANSQFETFRVSHLAMPFMKPDCKVLCNVRTKTLKPSSNVNLYFIETVTGY